MRSRSSCRALVVLLSLLGFPAHSAAQSVGREAPWWSLGFGVGTTRLTCDLCDPSRDLGGALDVALGMHARSGLRVGLEGGGWTHRTEDVRETVLRAGLVAHFSPNAARGFHLLGGLGWSGYRADDLAYDAVRLTLGVGWDLSRPIAGRWVIGNSLTVDAASAGSIRNGEDALAGSVGLSVVRLGLYVRRH